MRRGLVTRFARTRRLLSVRVERVEETIAVVTLDRPEKLNALDMAAFRGLRDAALELRDDTTVRAVVLRGAGRAFCAGLDVKSVMHPLRAKENWAELLGRVENEPANLAQAVSYLWRSVPCPVVCAVHGACFGGGFQIALGADVRIAAEDACLSVMEAKWGLIPDMGATVALRELTRRDVALELTTTGRVVPAREALALGLVTRVVAGSAYDEALDVARRIAAGSPDAAAAAKQLWHAAYDGPMGAPAERELLRLETDLQERLLGGWNQVACSASRGLGAPPALVPGFADRADAWGPEAQEAARAWLARLDDGPRFAVGTAVECNVGPDLWKRGTVVALDYAEEGWKQPAPYQIKLDDGRLIFAPLDEDSVVREPL